MGKRSKSDISNHALRIFLQDVGEFYDKKRGFKPFRPTKDQLKELLDFFNNRCCYCDVELKVPTLDHLIPTNRQSMGLHSWGNVVPSCGECNKEKHAKPWEAFLKNKLSKDLYNTRKNKIIC